MGFRTVIATLALFILGVLLFGSVIGLINGFIMMTGFIVLGLVLMEMDNAKRAKGGQGSSEE